jgi:hypothetical protein
MSLQAVLRARALLGDLDRSRRPADVAQVVHALQHELQLAAAGLVEHLTVEEPNTLPGAPRPVVLATGTQRSRVLEQLAHMADYGATDFELQADLSIGISSERRRRGELVDAGYVQAAMDGIGPVVRMHGSSPWTVWQVTASGRDALQRIGAGEQIRLL